MKRQWASFLLWPSRCESSVLAECEAEQEGLVLTHGVCGLRQPLLFVQTALKLASVFPLPSVRDLRSHYQAGFDTIVQTCEETFVISISQS